MSGNERQNRKVCTDDVFRERVPDGGSGSRKSSAADSGEFDRRHDEAIGGG